MLLAAVLLAASPSCLALTDDLTAVRGVYLYAPYIAATKKTRDIYEALRAQPTEIVIDPARTELPIMIDTQHEGWGIDVMGGQCITSIKADTVTLMSGQFETPATFVRVADDVPGTMAYLSRLIGLDGCYREGVCFHGATVTVDGVNEPFSFQRDPSELGHEGNYVKVGGDKLFWILRPTATGWRVYRGTWVSDDAYVKPDLKKPWRVLTRAR